MSHSRLIRTPGLLAAAMAASFCGVAQAGPEQTIFSAENALYGAGYEIGKADGWMDNTLRSAIRQYQSSHDELETTGNLDPETLSALGIAAGENVSVSGNTVADRQAAMAAVGLKDKRVDSSSATRTVAVAPEPEPELEPEALPEPAAEPEPEQEQVQEENTQDEPEAGFAATLASASGQNSQPEPKVPEIAETAQNSPAEEPAEPPTPEPEATASIEQAAAPESAEVTPQPAEVEPVPEEVEPARDEIATAEVENETEDTPVEVAAVEPPSETESQLPDEPTGAGNPEPAEPPQVARTSSANQTEARTVHESSGGFFSSIFDFLFGWLI